MTSFENFYKDLLDLSKKYEDQNIPLKIEQDLENDTVKVFGEKISPLSKAKNGLKDVTELAYTTAEHHPYWNLLYHSSEIANSILENWNGFLSASDLTDLDWDLKKLGQSLEKIRKMDISNP